MICVAVQGETNQALAQEMLNNTQNRFLKGEDGQPVPTGHWPLVKCEVLGVFTGENGARLELPVTDWAFAATLRIGTNVLVSTVVSAP